MNRRPSPTQQPKGPSGLKRLFGSPVTVTIGLFLVFFVGAELLRRQTDIRLTIIVGVAFFVGVVIIYTFLRSVTPSSTSLLVWSAAGLIQVVTSVLSLFSMREAEEFFLSDVIRNGLNLLFGAILIMACFFSLRTKPPKGGN